MSKHWKPGKKTVELRPVARPSRIRRDPVRIEEKKVQKRSEEREIWGGVAGVLLMAAAVTAVIVGISIATFSRYDPAAEARTQRFAQCYDADGPNCVLDGDTIYVGGGKVQIAGIAAPQIQGAQCDAERSRGIDSAVRLADLLNSGKVTVSPAFRDEYGRGVRSVQVKGRDVAERMINIGLARRYFGERPNWC
jgi:micrococcal nuclease